MRSNKLKLSFILSVIALFFIGLILQNAERIDAGSAIATVNGAQNVASSGNMVMAVILIWAIAMFAILAKHKSWFTILVLPVIFVAGCSGGGVYATTNPRDVVFVVDLSNPADQTQVTNKVVGNQADPKFWEGKMQSVNIQRIPIPTTYKRTGAGLFGSDVGAKFDPFPSVMVVTVPITAVTHEWIAPAISCDQPMPDMSNAFSMQSLEDNGGSTGVYTGASVTAVVDNPALYLSVYGYGDENPTTNTHAAKPLDEVISTTMHGFIQQKLASEYGTRNVVAQNRDMNTIFSDIYSALNTEFNKSGIKITSFFDRDGNIYENCAIQKQFDESLGRQNDLQKAEAAAKLKEIEIKSQLDASNAQATMTVSAGEALAKAQQAQANVVQSNPLSIQQQAIQKWDGHVSQYGSGAGGGIPFLVVMTPAPVATPPQ